MPGVSDDTLDADQSQFLLSERQPATLNEDKFDHGGHVKTLEKITKEADLPWHVGLYGTWGSGKSSVVNLLYRHIRASQRDNTGQGIYDAMAEMDRQPLDDVSPQQNFEDTLCVNLSAWKHAEQSVRTELILDFNRSIYEELEYRFGDLEHPTQENFDTDRPGVLDSSDVVTRLYDEEVDENKSRESLINWKQWFSELDHPVKIASVLSLLIMGFGVLLLVIQALGIFPVGEPISDYSGILAIIISGFGGTILSIIWSETKEARTNVEQTVDSPRKDWSGAYESLFDEIIEEAESLYRHNATAGDSTKSEADGPQLKRVVITVDDVDRCESHTAYQILIALKSFLQHDKCLYIIPCDDNALHRHLEAVDKSEYLSTDQNQQNFLEKFFETEIEVPQPTDKQLEEYLSHEVSRLEIDLNSSENSDTLPPKDVLAKARLNTPRKIKRVLNRIVTNKTLAENREIDLQAVTENDISIDSYIAFVSVLQVNYPLFADEIQRDPEQLNEIYTQLTASNGNEGELNQLYDEMELSVSQRGPLTQFLSAAYPLTSIVTNPGPFFRLSEGPADAEAVFEPRFERGQIDLLSRMLREATEQDQAAPEEVADEEDVPSKASANSSEESRASEGGSAAEPDEMESQVGQTDRMNRYIKVIARHLRDDVSREHAFQKMLAIVDDLPKDSRQELGAIIVEEVSDTETAELLENVEFDELKPLFGSMKVDDRVGFVVGYVNTLVGTDGLRWQNVTSLLDKTGGVWEVYEAKEAFQETIIDGRVSGNISDEDYGRLLAYLKTNRRELFSTDLVEAK